MKPNSQDSKAEQRNAAIKEAEGDLDETNLNTSDEDEGIMSSPIIFRGFGVEETVRAELLRSDYIPPVYDKLAIFSMILHVGRTSEAEGPSTPTFSRMYKLAQKAFKAKKIETINRLYAVLESYANSSDLAPEAMPLNLDVHLSPASDTKPGM